MEALHGSGNQSVRVQIVVDSNMDDIFTSDVGTPIDEQSNLSLEEQDLLKQREYLDTYLKSLPYPCETEEQMNAHLEHIVGKLSVCVETKDWMASDTWSGLLEWCAWGA